MTLICNHLQFEIIQKVITGMQTVVVLKKSLMCECVAGLGGTSLHRRFYTRHRIFLLHLYKRSKCEHGIIKRKIWTTVSTVGRCFIRISLSVSLALSLTRTHARALLLLRMRPNENLVGKKLFPAEKNTLCRVCL